MVASPKSTTLVAIGAWTADAGPAATIRSPATTTIPSKIDSCGVRRRRARKTRGSSTSNRRGRLVRLLPDKCPFALDVKEQTFQHQVANRLANGCAADFVALAKL